MTRKFIGYLATIMLLISCTPKISTHITVSHPPRSSSDSVLVFEPSESLPEKALAIGTVKIGDTGFSTKCDYETVLEKAKEEARKVGGNAIKIITHKEPDFFSTCHRIEARILILDKLQKTVSTQVQPEQQKIASPYTPYSRWRFGINAGYTYQLGKIDKSVQSFLVDYQKSLKSGFHVWMDINYFFDETNGCGFNFYTSSFSNMLDGVTASNQNGQVIGPGKMSDDITIRYFGPTYTARHHLGTKYTIFASGGLGIVNYVDEGRFILNNMKISGNTLGCCYSIGLDRVLSPKTAMGIRLSLFTGNLFSYDYFDGKTTTHIKADKDGYITVSHLDLSIGFRFNTEKK